VAPGSVLIASGKRSRVGSSSLEISASAFVNEASATPVAAAFA